MRNKIIFGVLAFAFAGSTFAANRPSGYVTICSENATCSVPTSTNVAFGRSDQFFYKVLTGSFVCSSATFGGRIAGGVNECSVPSGTASSSSSKSSVSSSSSSKSSSSSSVASSSSSSATSSSSSSAASNTCAVGAVLNGVDVDCGGKTLSLSCLSDTEGQAAVISLQNGATLRNVHIAAGGGAHGISCLAGNCTLRNVTWDEVCEHAAGNYSAGGTYSIYDSTAYQNLDSLAIDGNKPDKFFQDNAIGSKMYVRNFTAIMVDTDGSMSSSGKILRTCGDCSANGGPRTLDMDGLTVKHVAKDRVTRATGPGISTIAGINTQWDSSVPADVAIPDKVILRNIKIQDYKLSSDGVKSTPKVCDTYVGSRIHNGSTSIGQVWNSASCDVQTTDVTSF